MSIVKRHSCTRNKVEHKLTDVVTKKNKVELNICAETSYEALNTADCLVGTSFMCLTSFCFLKKKVVLGAMNHQW